MLGNEGNDPLFLTFTSPPSETLLAGSAVSEYTARVIQLLFPSPNCLLACVSEYFWSHTCDTQGLLCTFPIPCTNYTRSSLPVPNPMHQLHTRFFSPVSVQSLQRALPLRRILPSSYPTGSVSRGASTAGFTITPQARLRPALAPIP